MIPIELIGFVKVRKDKYTSQDYFNHPTRFAEGNLVNGNGTVGYEWFLRFLS